MDPVVDIAFDCLPLRSLARVDVPLDASPAFRARCERLQRAINVHGAENAYYLYNAFCTYRFANSEIEGMLRFSFDGTVLTDRSDAKTLRAYLDIVLVAETCGDVPDEVFGWLQRLVERAVLIEFDRFIEEGSLAHRVDELGRVDSIAAVANFAGMHL